MIVDNNGPFINIIMVDSSQKKSVLIVDDDAFCINLVTMMLMKLGEKVEGAPNGKKAVEKFRENGKNYKGILMDFHMPEMNGFEAAVAIREIESEIGVSVPIYGLTGDDAKTHADLH